MRHSIRIRSPASPYLTRKKRLKLRSDKSHLRRQVHSLLANELEICRTLFIKENYRFAVHHAVLRTTEGKHIDTNIRRNLFQRRFETHCRIRETRPINVKQHAVVVRESGKRLQLFLCVDGAHLRGL